MLSLAEATAHDRETSPSTLRRSTRPRPHPLPDGGRGAPREAAPRRERSPFDAERPLVNNISTDELTPGWVCYYYDETLARYCLVGLRGGVVQQRRDQERRLRRHRQRPSRRAAAARARRRRTASARRACRSSSPRASRRSTGRTAQNIGLLTTHRLRRSSTASQRGEEIPIERVHQRARPHQRGRRRARRALRLQRGAPRGRGLAAAVDHDAAAADDALREDPRRARRSSTPSAASSACPR